MGAKKPATSVRYVLSADQKLRRLSLRKMSDDRKKAKSQARSGRSRRVAAPTESSHEAAPSRARWASPRVIGFGIAGVISVAILIAAGFPSDTAGVDTPAASLPAQPQPQSEGTAPGADAKLALAPAAKDSSTTGRSTRTSAAVERVKPSAAAAATTAAAAATTATAPTESRRADSAAKTAAPGSTTSDSKDATVVTVTGCLARDGQTFRLKDVSGAEAPKARSWRSGFMRKRPSTVNLVDGSNALKLHNHVGERVAATGTMKDRALRARSLRVIARSCA